MMRYLIATAVLVAPASSVTAQTESWFLRKQTTSNICHVQQQGEQPVLGATVSSHPSRKAACEAGLTAFDKSLSDTSKCWTYAAGTRDRCNRDGVDLPQ